MPPVIAFYIATRLWWRILTETHDDREIGKAERTPRSTGPDER